MQHTIFLDRFATMKQETNLDFLELQAGPPEAESKAELPLLKLAKFGNLKTDKNCLRSDRNIEALWGAEIDYDEGAHSIHYAADKLREADIAAFLYSSPSNSNEKPHWRILLPFSKEFRGSTEAMRKYRAEAVRQTEKVLGFKVANESYTLSQAYYYGRVNGALYDTVHIEGTPIDRAYNLRGKSNCESSGFLVSTSEGVDVADAVNDVLTGKHLHEPLRSLSASYAAKGMREADIIETLRGHLGASQAKGSARWQDRYEDIPRLVRSAVEKFAPAEKVDAPERTVEDMIADFELTEADVANLKETEFLYQRIIPSGHMMAIVGEPGAGKTTIMEFVAGQIAGVEVVYVNADVAAGDMPEALRRARQGGYRVLCPDQKEGKSMDDVVSDLKAFAASGADLSQYCFILDTLKKMAEVIDKRAARGLYQLLRGLTARGATVICLGHCNKYPDQEGWPVYEGTADLRSDFDELALLHAHDGDYGISVASLYWREQGLPWGKSRSPVEAMSWDIDVSDGRRVTERDEWVDTVASSKEQREVKKIADVIRDVLRLLSRYPKGLLQQQILDKLEGVHAQHAVRKALRLQDERLWHMEIVEKNGKLRTLIPGAKFDRAARGNKHQFWGQKA